MRRFHVHVKPTPVDKLKLDDFYYEVTHDWEHKAEALRARRWRALRRAERGRYATR